VWQRGGGDKNWPKIAWRTLSTAPNVNNNYGDNAHLLLASLMWPLT